MSALALEEEQTTKRATEPRALGSGTLLAGVLILITLTFIPSLRYQFVYDDQGQIVENEMISAWHFVPQYFQGHVWQHLFPNAVANYYRPLNILWFRFNDAVFGLRPAGWHASTIMLHLIAATLVFAIVLRLTTAPLVAAFTALLFGLHPTRHEVVAWVSGSTESLCAVLFLSAFLAYLNRRERRAIRWMCVSCLLYGAALLSKETAVVLPGLVGIHSFLYADGEAGRGAGRLLTRAGRAIGRASVYAPVAIVYGVLRIRMLHGFSHPLTSLRLSAVLLTLPSVVAFYLKQWIFPVRMLLFYDLFPRTNWSFQHVLLPAIAVLAMVSALYYWGRKHAGRELAFAGAAALLPLLPVLYISIFPASELVHDRYAYLPGFGMSLAVALLCRPFFKGPLVAGIPRGLALLSAAVILPLAYSTANASSYWVDNYALFEHASQMAPLNVTAKNNYGTALDTDGQQGNAMAIFQDILREHPNNFLANYNLGRILYEVNLLDPAEHYLQAAQRIDPTRPDTYLQLGLVYMKAGVLDKAAANFRQATVLTPNDSKVRFAYGVALAQQEDCTGARVQFGDALSLNPQFAKAREQMDKCGKALPTTEASSTTGVAEPARPPSAASTVLTRPKLASAKETRSARP